MARMLRTASASGHRPLPLSDLDHGLATASIACGAIGILLAAIGVPVPGIVIGLVGMAAGLWAQMVSRTRPERFADMAGLLASFLAVAIGLSKL